MKIWEDNIYGKAKLSTREDLAPLQALMEDQKIHSLHKIYDYNEPSKNRLGWKFGSPTDPLIPLVISLAQGLSGYAPWNRFEKDSR